MTGQSRRWSRRTLLERAGIAGAAALAPGLTGGCGRSRDDALTFFFGANPEEAKTRMTIIAAFAKKHPDIKIRTQIAGPDPLQQMLTSCAGGNCPDIMMAWELLYAGLAKRGVLVDLNDLLKKDASFAAELKADSSTTLYNTFAFEGGQYALPEQFAGVFLYYNKKHFAEARLDPPPARWEDAWTFAEFLETAKALTKRDKTGKVEQWGFVDPWDAILSAGIFGMNNGAEWFSPAINPTRSNIADDRFLEGFQFYADLATRHRVAPRMADAQAVANLDMFIQGKASMALVGHWMYPAFTGAKGLDFDVTVLPVGPRGGPGAKSDVGTTGLAIAADSPRKEEAWEFVKFACGPEGQAIIAESGLFIPVLESAARSPGFAKAHKRLKNLEVFTGGLNNAHYLPVTPIWGKIDLLLRRETNKVLRGTAQASTFKGGLANDVNELLSGV